MIHVFARLQWPKKAKANAKATAAKRQLAGSTASTHSFKCHFKLKWKFMAFYLHCRICWPIRTYMHMYVCTVYVWLRLLLVAVSLPSRSTPPENWGKCNIHMAIRLEHREKFYVQKTILFNISFCLPNNIVISKALFLIERTMSSSALESSMRCVQCSCLFYRSDVNTYATQNSTLYICHGNNLFLFSLFCQKFVTCQDRTA